MNNLLLCLGEESEQTYSPIKKVTWNHIPPSKKHNES